MAKDKNTPISKEELMKQVLGKNRGMNIHTSSSELERLRENSEKISQKIRADFSEVSANKEATELLDTLLENQRTMQEISEEVDISDLKAQIAKDFGVASNPVSEQGSDLSSCKWNEILPIDIKRVSEDMQRAVEQDVIGQSGAVADIIEGFMRPYTRGNGSSALRGVIYVYGARGSGRHLLVEKAIEAANGRLASGIGVFRLDMADYQENSSEGVFVQDVFSALYGESHIIVVENFERAHININGMLGELIKKGFFKLNKRYVQKNGLLQESEKTLSRSHISEFHGNDKLLIFISEKKKQALIDVYGRDVAESVLDIVATTAFDEQSLRAVAEKLLSDMKVSLESVSRAKVKIADGVCDALVDMYDSFNGVHSFIGALSAIKTKFFDNSVARIGQDSEILYDGVFAIQYVGGDRIDIVSSAGEIDAIKAEISEIVGLDEVKEYLYSLENLVKTGAVRRRMGLKSDAVTRHMIFTGNPGTGKTTIARLVAKLMKAIGALEQGHLVEVTRADLVGRYVGHTAPLTMNVIKSALGGVLFIDEAYSLYRGRDDSFGLEAIDALVKGMEDNRDNLMVILAGYSDEMEVFLTSNSGLRSRFPKSVHFDDYSEEELLKIAISIARHKDYIIDGAVLEPLKKFLGAKNKDERSNGRLARNVVEAAIIKQSGRVFGGDEAAMKTLVLEDFDLQ